jgi:hypothetical protein
MIKKPSIQKPGSDSSSEPVIDILIIPSPLIQKKNQTLLLFKNARK